MESWITDGVAYFNGGSTDHRDHSYIGIIWPKTIKNRDNYHSPSLYTEIHIVLGLTSRRGSILMKVQSEVLIRFEGFLVLFRQFYNIFTTVAIWKLVVFTPKEILKFPNP